MVPSVCPLGCSSAAVVGQDSFSPGDDGVHDLVVFGNLTCRVEVSEPFEGLVGAVEIFGFIQMVEFPESIPSCSQPGNRLRTADLDASGGRR